MPSNALYRVPDTTLNALSGPPTVLGMNPLVNRLALIPRYSRQEGVVMPQWVYDMARAAQAPGNALMGHQTTPEEALNFAGNVSLGAYGASSIAPESGRIVGMGAGTRGSFEEMAKRQRMAQGLKAAVRDPLTGKVYSGWTHQGAIDFAAKTRSDADTSLWGRLYHEWDKSTDNVGFVDSGGNFISRSQADEQMGILTMEDRRDLLNGKPR